MRILVADDEPAAREAVARVLASLGHEALQAEDGEAALTLLHGFPTRIVVSDWGMPGLDGLALCERIRALRDRDYTYFILLTGRKPSREEYLEAMGKGVDDFLGKPFDREELGVRLRVAERIVTLTERVTQLEGLLPICTYCKRIRREDKTYEGIEAYVMARSKARFSHGICPDCLKKHHPDAAR